MNNPFSDRYQRLPDKELLDILAAPNGYQPIAIDAARQELDVRAKDDPDIHEALDLYAKRAKYDRRMGSGSTSDTMDMTPPVQVRMATALLWGSLVIGILNFIGSVGSLDADISTKDMEFIEVVMAIGIVFTAILIYKIGRGRNWARVTLLVSSVIGLIPFCFSLKETFDESVVIGAVSCITVIMQLVALYLIFSYPGSEWFQKLWKYIFQQNESPSIGRQSMSVSSLGLLVFLGGAVLIIGNMTGAFPTFPFAGFIVTTIGGLIINAGESLKRKEAEAAISELLNDDRYTAAVRMIVEDGKRKEITTEAAWDRATNYLIDEGIPSEEAKENLLLVLSLHLEAYNQQRAK